MTAPGPACAGSRVDFHDVAQTAAAMDVCNGDGNGDEEHAPCPQRADCLARAVARDEKYGVWGGESFDPASDEGLKAPPPAEAFPRPVVHARHGVRGVPCTAGPDGGRCAECRSANAAYVRDWLLRRRKPAPVTQSESLDLPEQLALVIEGISA